MASKQQDATTDNWRPEVDLHCHILPEWDDGPDTLDDALAMAKRAADAGLKIVVATPHVGRDFRRRKQKRPADVIAEGVASLQNAINERGIELEILPGAEILLGSVDVQTRLPAELALTYGHKGKFALIESPFPTWPPFGWQVVQNMSVSGVTPVIAHPERYLDVQKDPKIMEQIIGAGGVIQITADAILGATGKPMRDCCFRLLRDGQVSLVSSDAHSVKNHLPLDCVSKVTELVGERAARAIFVDNPRRLLAGERVTAPRVEAPKSPAWQFWKK